MKRMNKIIFSGLMAALTAAATILIQIPSPLSGYIHPGDGLVILSGIFLGPLWGGLAAGIGSMFADLFSGYLLYAPATLIIKFCSAACAGLYFSRKKDGNSTVKKKILRVSFSGAFSAAIMITGYFLFESFIYTPGAALFNIPFNLIQGILGIFIAGFLYPFLQKIFSESHS